MSTESDWYGPETATFGDRIAGARELAGMSQAQLARRLGVKKNTILAWEDDRSDPRANRLQMMAGLLNVSITWLLTGEGDGPDGPKPEGSADAGLAELAAEMRELRAQMRRNAEAAARIEKQLRNLIQET
ncbi:MAG: helix-turn-helix transcriptional regulator [Pseudomonadota bacterium]